MNYTVTTPCQPCPAEVAQFEAYRYAEGLGALLEGFNKLDHYGVRREAREAILTTIGADARHFGALVEKWEKAKASAKPRKRTRA